MTGGRMNANVCVKCGGRTASAHDFFCGACNRLREKRIKELVVTYCAHRRWEPRMGRYRCTDCRAVGSLVDGVVVPYVCTVRGCGEAAVSCSRSSGQLCRGHQ